MAEKLLRSSCRNFADPTLVMDIVTNMPPPWRGFCCIIASMRTVTLTPTGKYYTCSNCQVSKDTSEYFKDTTVKRGHRSCCRDCARAIRRKQPSKQATNFEKRDLIRSAKAVPCADCGNSFPFFVMDLDHLPEYKKSFQLGQYVQHTLFEIQEEIKKCEPVCANCHRYRTAKRAGMI